MITSPGKSLLSLPIYLDGALTVEVSLSSISISVLRPLPSVFLLDVDVQKLLFDLFSCCLICFVLILEHHSASLRPSWKLLLQLFQEGCWTHYPLFTPMVCRLIKDKHFKEQKWHWWLLTHWTFAFMTLRSLNGWHNGLPFSFLVFFWGVGGSSSSICRTLTYGSS